MNIRNNIETTRVVNSKINLSILNTIHIITLKNTQVGNKANMHIVVIIEVLQNFQPVKLILIHSVSIGN